MIFNRSKKTQEKLIIKTGNAELQTKQLMIDLATRAYKLEQGRHPNSPSDLVPDYLKAVPVDPTTGTNLTYLP